MATITITLVGLGSPVVLSPSSALKSHVFLGPSSSLNPRLHGSNKRTPFRVIFPIKRFPSLSIRLNASASPITPIIPTTRSSTLTGPTRSLATLSALTIAVTKVLLQKVVVAASSPGGSLFFASVGNAPPGYLNKPLMVVALGIKKWLDVYSGVLMVRVLLSWFPNVNWEKQPLSAMRHLCDPYLNLFRSIFPPVFGTLDVSPMLAFAVLGTLGSIIPG